MKRSVPFILTTFRLLLGPVALMCAIEGAPRIVYLPILVAGTLSDIFDGILARRLQVATPFLRRYDSVTDMIYYLFLLAVAWKLCAPVLSKSICAIAILLVSEAACIAVSVARFRRYPATHTYLAKFYGLALLGCLVALLVFNASAWAIVVLAVIGVFTNAEIVIIHFTVKSPPMDVTSVFALSRRGV